MIVKLPNNLVYSRSIVKDFNVEEFKNEFLNSYSFIVVHGQILNVDEAWKIDKKYSAVIPILEDEEEQMSIYHATCRNEIRRSYKIEEFSIEHNSTPIEELFQFHKLCEKLRGWIPVPPEELEASEVICIRLKEELIAGMTAYSGDDFLRIGRIFSLRKLEKYSDLQQIVFSAASRRVVHEFTKLARSKNMKWLDLGGLVIEGDALKSGITKFKLSFGSQSMPVNILRFEGEGYSELQSYFEDNHFDLT